MFQTGWRRHYGKTTCGCQWNSILLFSKCFRHMGDRLYYRSIFVEFSFFLFKGAFFASEKAQESSSQDPASLWLWLHYGGPKPRVRNTLFWVLFWNLQTTRNGQSNSKRSRWIRQKKLQSLNWKKTFFITLTVHVPFFILGHKKPKSQLIRCRCKCNVLCFFNDIVLH